MEVPRDVRAFYQFPSHQVLISFKFFFMHCMSFTFLSNTDYVTQDVLLWKALHIQEIFCETCFNIVQSCHMHRSSMHWLYDKLEMQCYALYWIILNPLHWAGIPWRYNLNYDGMEEKRCPRHDIFMCLKVNDYTLKLYWLDISASHWIIWCEVHLISIDFIQRIMLSTNPSLCSVKSHLCWSLVVTITCSL